MNSFLWRRAQEAPLTAPARRLSCRAAALLLLPVTVLISPPALACATCGCTLSADAAMGYSTSAGWRLSVEYDYIHQDQLRSGTHAVSGVPDGKELERETLNRYITAGVELQPQLLPGTSRLLRAVRGPNALDLRGVRFHPAAARVEHLAQLEPGGPAAHRQLPGVAADSQPGRAAGGEAAHAANMARRSTSTADRMRETPLDASLQPGTGSTDMIVGAYYYQAISQDFDVFVNGAVPERRQASHGSAGQ